MNTLNKTIESHYQKHNLYEDIIAKLVEKDIDLSRVKRTDISGVDEFHVRGAEVTNEIAKKVGIRGKEVLDVGCGIGGPCRLWADKYGCVVTGIDISHEFVRTARKLSILVGLDSKTSFVVGDATNLPFAHNSFDLVWTQHVQMNIKDKEKFYSEIIRVLRPNGSFVYYDIFKANDKTVEYPMPWAGDSSISFLWKSEEMDHMLVNLDLEKIESKDETEKGITFFEKMVDRLKTNGPPKIGLNILMGKTTKTKIQNLLSHLKNGALRLESGHYRIKVNGKSLRQS